MPSLEIIESAIATREAKPAGAETLFLCPCHDDHHPSASWNSQKQVWHCHACGANGGALNLAGHLGLSVMEAEPRSYPAKTTATVQPLGCTLAQYAEAKRLPLDFLRNLGMSRFLPLLHLPGR